MNSKKILITGPTGFVGRNLILRLLNEGYSVIALKRENSDASFLNRHNISYLEYKNSYSEVYEFMLREKPDGIIHLAAFSFLNHDAEDINEIVNINILFPLHLIEAATALNIKWFINTGTFWQHYNNQNYSPVNLYAASKQAFEDLAQFYYEGRKIHFSTLMLFDNFGSNDTRKKMINTWLKIAQTGEKFSMSPGEQVIDVSHIDNVTEGFFTLMELMIKSDQPIYNGKVFKINSGERMTLKEFAGFFEKQIGAKLNIAWGEKEYREREVMEPWDKAEEIPGYKIKVDLSAAIKSFYSDFIKENV